MEAKITSTKNLQVYPSQYNADQKQVEEIFISEILGLKNEGDSILLTRRNASGLSCLAYLESRPLKQRVMPKIVDLQKENEKLIALLQMRDGGDHDNDCKANYGQQCNCGHNVVKLHFDSNFTA